MSIPAKKARWLASWILVRPRRWLVHKMVGGTYLNLKFSRWWDGSIIWPNPHWWILDKTAFRFFSWLNYDAWRVFCNWEGGYRRTYPLSARIIHRIGQTTAGYAISGGECFHCASPDGCQVELADDDTGKTFILEGTRQVDTMDGVDHQFWGTTVCPKCGYRAEYSDGSL